MKKIIYILLLGWFFSLISCSDFLEPKSNTEYSPKDVESLNDVLLGEAIPGYSSTRSYYGFLYILDDDITTRPYISGLTTTAGNNPYDESVIKKSIVFYSWTEDYERAFSDLAITSGYIGIYQNVYKYIAGANVALDYVDELEGSIIEKRNVKAQALALRAFHYFHLTNIYGTPYNSHPNGLGVPLKLTSKVEDRRLPRNTVKECYEQIEKDLLEAEDNYLAMGKEHQWKANYRPSLRMVRLMLSRMYLYMENWKESARYAKLLLEEQDADFQLIDLNTLPIPTFTGSNRTEYHNFIGYYNTNSGENKTKNNDIIWVYGNAYDGRSSDEKLSISNTGNSPAFFNASQELLMSYGEGLENIEDDLRYTHYIVSERYNYNNNAIVKRAYGKMQTGTYANGRWPVSTDQSFGHALRLPEAYLNYAEAMAMMVKEGETNASSAEVINTLNALREKRIKAEIYKPLTSADFKNAEELVNFVRNERRRELCFEDGHRWFDLRRYGMPEIKHIWRDESNQEGTEYTLPQNAKFYAVPLQQTVLDLNTDLEANSWK